MREPQACEFPGSSPSPRGRGASWWPRFSVHTPLLTRLCKVVPKPCMWACMTRGGGGRQSPVPLGHPEGGAWTRVNGHQEPEFSGYFEAKAKTGEIWKQVKMEIELEPSFKMNCFKCFWLFGCRAVAVTEWLFTKRTRCGWQGELRLHHREVHGSPPSPSGPQDVPVRLAGRSFTDDIKGR